MGWSAAGVRNAIWTPAAHLPSWIEGCLERTYAVGYISDGLNNPLFVCHARSRRITHNLHLSLRPNNSSGRFPKRNNSKKKTYLPKLPPIPPSRLLPSILYPIHLFFNSRGSRESYLTNRSIPYLAQLPADVGKQSVPSTL